MKKKIKIIIILMLLIITTQITYISANSETTLKEQQGEFGIQEFVKNSKNYAGEFFEDIDINKVLNDSIKGDIDNSGFIQKVINLLGKEVIETIKTISIILVIIVIHSILKSLTQELENEGISKLVYYVQYILIVTIIMTNFADTIKLVQDTVVNLVSFINMLVPLLTSLMIYTGSITTSSILEPTILLVINFLGNIIQNVIIPLVLIFTSLVIISKLSDKVQIDKMAKFMKSGIIWFLGVIITIFVGVISLEGTISSTVDGITAKTTKSVVTSAVPVVGKILGDAVDTVLRLWNHIKKCSRICRSINSNRNMYNANIKTNSHNSFI